MHQIGGGCGTFFMPLGLSQRLVCMHSALSTGGHFNLQGRDTAQPTDMGLPIKEPRKCVKGDGEEGNES
jgi:hypothetical protein